ncbi:MAG: hypothetical protein K6A74_02165, partial [Lachnospiraceae bacterium]|nr:hypothetical protein [Lachnospiraceae bacterium]
MQIKLLAVFALVLCALVVLLSRITYITAKSGNQYAKQVLSQQSYDSQTIPYRRGEILDRNGIILAKSDLVYNLVLDCRQVNSDEKYKEPTVKALVEVFGLSETQIREKIDDEKTRDSQYQVLLKKISEDDKRAFEAYVSTAPERNLTREERIELARVQGIWFEEQYDRDYPYGKLASNVIGFSNDIDQGVVGIENYYNSMLNGINGRIFGYLNSDSEFEKKTIEPEHGKTLVSTLDMNIQEIVEKHIAAFDETYGTEESKGKGAKNVGVVVMDPDTGEILGMACNSSFDLNDPQDMSQLYTNSELKAMDDNEYVDALNAMWANFCVSTSYEPGSVFKPVTVASALECGAVKDGDEFYCDGGQFITDTQINCDNIYGHGEETLEYAIVNSCNDALMQIGMKVGITNFVNYQRDFNFGNPTGIDLPNETAGVVYNRDTMHEVELATCTFGQGFTISMIQEIAAFSTVINGGYYYQPHVIRQVRNADGSVEKTVDPLILRQPVSSANSALVRRYLTTAVQKGTGRRSQVPGYLTGGKTGTAEKINPETGRRATGKYLVSFIGACPMDDPEVVIYVVVDEPNVYQQADSTFAQTLFRKIATEVFPYMGLYPTETVSPDLLAYLGITEADIVKGGRAASTTFDCFDSSGRYYSNAYVNKDMIVVDQNGNPLDGVVVDVEAQTVTDAKGNVKQVDLSKEEKIDPVAENPDIATPAQMVSAFGSSALASGGVAISGFSATGSIFSSL